MAGVGDVVRYGLVASLAHPGGNVTGITLITQDVTAKALELLKEVVPQRTSMPAKRIYRSESNGPKPPMQLFVCSGSARCSTLLFPTPGLGFKEEFIPDSFLQA